MTLPWNDLDALEALFRTRGSEIAAVICEPVVGNMGLVPPEPGFLEAILRLTAAHGAVSIFDEVMTGCRLSRNGHQGIANLKPDMTCLGKIVGGGLPLAAYGGRREIMEKVAPLGPVYQAGTLSGNPIAVTAGLTTLALLSPQVYERLEHLGARIEQGLRGICAQAGVNACIQRRGSMFTLFFAAGPVRNFSEATQADTKRFARFHRELLKRGIYFPPSQFEAAFISVAHTDADIDETLAAAELAITG